MINQFRHDSHIWRDAYEARIRQYRERMFNQERFRLHLFGLGFRNEELEQEIERHA